VPLSLGFRGAFTEFKRDETKLLNITFASNSGIMADTTQYDPQRMETMVEVLEEMLQTGQGTSLYINQIYDIMVKNSLTLILRSRPCTLDCLERSEH
jgi:hypothetical protein